MSIYSFFKDHNNSFWTDNDADIGGIVSQSFAILGGVAVFLFCLAYVYKYEGGNERMMRELEPDDAFELIPRTIERRHSI